jgi:hypothetical protein
MGTFFGPPIRVGIPIGVSAGFRKQAGTVVPPTPASVRVTVTAVRRVTATGDVRVTA